MAKKAVKSFLHRCKEVFTTVSGFRKAAKWQKGRKKPFAPLQRGFYDGFKLSQGCKMAKKAVKSLLHRCKEVFTTVSSFRKAAKWQKRP